MTDSKKQILMAQDTLLNDEIVPGVKNNLVPYTSVDKKEKANIDELIAEINMHDSNSIIFFGSKAQENVTKISDKMLEGVKNKELGSSGEALNEMVATIRGFDINELDPNAKQGFFAKLFRKMKPLAKFLQKYETVKKQIDLITHTIICYSCA